MQVRSLAGVAALCCVASLTVAQRATAQHLSRVQILALQQQLRDDGCGVDHTTGQLDAMTRRAVEKCKSKYNVTSGGAADLLSAMNIGFGPNDQMPTLAMANGNSTSMTSDTSSAATRRATSRAMRRGRRMGNGRMRRTGSDSTTMTKPDSTGTMGATHP